MLRDVFVRIVNEYELARNEPFSKHPLAFWIRRDIPKIFEAVTPRFPHLKWVASPGQGQWADTPWIAAFDPVVTESAQIGYYPVYLFTKSLGDIFLSLNQGMAQLRKELGTEAKNVLAHRASILRTRLSPGYKDRFPFTEISLGATDSQSRLAFYQPGHAFGVRYRGGWIPSEMRLVDDLNAMLELYSLATALGGTQELNTTGHSIAEQGEEYDAFMSFEEMRQLRYHYRIERNKKLANLAKQVHGYQCQVCNFEFEIEYGQLGHEYIEAHHLTPLAELPPNQSVKLSPIDDFRVVCANCHRMIHRRGAPESFDEFRDQYWRLRLHK